MQPTIPVADIIPDAIYWRTLLIKPGYTRHMILHRFFCNIESMMRRWTKSVAQEIKPPAYPTDNGFIRMFFPLSTA